MKTIAVLNNYCLEMKQGHNSLKISKEKDILKKARGNLTSSVFVLFFLKKKKCPTPALVSHC